MGQDLGLDGQPGVFPLSDRFAEMGGIPVNDDGGEQVEPCHAVVLALAGAVADFAPAPNLEGVLERVMSLALVQVGVGPTLHIGVVQLIDDAERSDEERSFDPSDFAESDGQFVLARIGRELSQQLARRNGAAGQGGSNPQDVSISPLFVHPGRRGPVRKRTVQRTGQSVAPTPARPEPAASHMNGTETIANTGPYSYTPTMMATLIGYARCCTDRQYLAAQRRRFWSFASPKIASTPITASSARTAPAPISTRPSPPCAKATRWSCPNSTGWQGPSRMPAPSPIGFGNAA